MGLDKVIENIRRLEVTGEFAHDLVCAFGDYKFGGEIDVAIIRDTDTAYRVKIQTKHADQQVININTDHEKVTDVWKT